MGQSRTFIRLVGQLKTKWSIACCRAWQCQQDGISFIPQRWN